MYEKTKLADLQIHSIVTYL